MISDRDHSCLQADGLLENWRVLGTGEAEEWHAVLSRFAQTDVYLLPEYHRAYELNGDGVARAFVAAEGDRVLFYPFFVRPIEPAGSGPWYDIETVYGYSGPLSTSTDPEFLTRAWAAFAGWCRENRIVAEFIRFNPLLKNHEVAAGTCRVGLDRNTVAVNLDCSEEELWDAYPSAQRTKVRKAQKSGLVGGEVPVAEGLGRFRQLYHRTMEWNEARPYYHFSDAYFNHLCGALAGGVKLFAVRDGERMVAAALFLVHQGNIHYHLGGSDADYREARPNNLLFHTVGLWGLARGCRWLHLGGGRTPDPEDSLYRFKACLSRLRLPFHVGRRVHDAGVYESLCSDWVRRSGVKERPKYFLLYRLGGVNEPGY